MLDFESFECSSPDFTILSYRFESTLVTDIGKIHVPPLSCRSRDGEWVRVDHGHELDGQRFLRSTPSELAGHTGIGLHSLGHRPHNGQRPFDGVGHFRWRRPFSMASAIFVAAAINPCNDAPAGMLASIAT
jgi:hypothetical protein